MYHPHHAGGVGEVVAGEGDDDSVLHVAVYPCAGHGDPSGGVHGVGWSLCIHDSCLVKTKG